MNSEARRIGAALEHIKKTGNLQDFAGTRNERVAMIGTAIARGLVVWDKEREKYDLTPHGERQLAAYLAPERSLIRGLASVRTIAAVAGLGGVAMAALWLAAGSLGGMPQGDDEATMEALVIAEPEARPDAEAASASAVDHSEVAASARPRASALPAPAKADQPGLAEPDFATKPAAPPPAVPVSGTPAELVGAAPAGAAVPQPASEAGKLVTVSLNQEHAPAPPRRPRPTVATATDAVPRTPVKTAPVPLPARRPPAGALATAADARTPERVEPAVSPPRPPAAALAAAAGPRTPERAEPAVSPPRTAAAVPARKPVPAPAMATGASERLAASTSTSTSAPEPAAVPGSAVGPGPAPVAEPPRRPAEPRTAAVEPPLNARPDAGAIADRARSEAEARPLPRPGSEGSVRAETRTFVYPNGTVVTVVRTPRRGEAWQREAEDAIARHSAPDARSEGSSRLAYSGEERALRRAPGLPDGALRRAYGEGERSLRCSEPEGAEDGDRDLAYGDEDPDLADAWRQRSGVPERFVAPRRPPGPGAIEAPPPCAQAPYEEEADLDWRMSAWERRFR